LTEKQNRIRINKFSDGSGCIHKYNVDVWDELRISSKGLDIRTENFLPEEYFMSVVLKERPDSSLI
jgi:hypothetical protein